MKSSKIKMKPDTLYDCVEAILNKYSVTNIAIGAMNAPGVKIELTAPCKSDIRRANGERGVEALAQDLKDFSRIFNLGYRTYQRDKGDDIITILNKSVKR